MKKVLSFAIAAALVAPAAAMADATVYGKIRMSVDNVSIDLPSAINNNPEGGTNDVDEWQLNSHSSRLGAKGSEDLGNGLKAIWKLEFGVNIADQDSEFSGSNPAITSRNQFVGLAGNWGTALIGRHDTPMKMSTGRLDYFADTVADNEGIRVDTHGIGIGGTEIRGTEDLADRRAAGTIAYVTPNFSGFTGAVAIVPGENSQNNGADGLADAYSLAGMYGNGPLYLSAAYEAADGASSTNPSAGIVALTGVGDLAQWRVGAGWDAGDWKVGAVYEAATVDNPAGGTDLVDYDTWEISGGLKLGMGMVKAKYFDYSDDGLGTRSIDANGGTHQEMDHNGFVIGYDYNFSKRTQLSALYLSSTFDDVIEGDVDVDVFSVQLNHNF